MKYIYEIYDGDEWMPVLNEQYDSPAEAKQAGVDAGFEYVRVVAAIGESA